jgi:hypothetical protein
LLLKKVVQPRRKGAFPVFVFVERKPEESEIPSWLPGGNPIAILGLSLESGTANPDF